MDTGGRAAIRRTGRLGCCAAGAAVGLAGCGGFHVPAGVANGTIPTVRFTGRDRPVLLHVGDQIAARQNAYVCATPRSSSGVLPEVGGQGRDSHCTGRWVMFRAAKPGVASLGGAPPCGGLDCEEAYASTLVVIAARHTPSLPPLATPAYREPPLHLDPKLPPRLHGCLPDVDTTALVGLSAQQALARVAGHGCVALVLVIDGRAAPIPATSMPFHFDLAVAHGRVVSATPG